MAKKDSSIFDFSFDDEEPKSKAEDKAFEKFGEMMIKKIESFKGKWNKPWFSSNGMMPESIDGRPYNGVNIFMLLMETEEQGYAAPIFGTFDKFASLNFDKNRKLLKDKAGNPLPHVGVNKGEVSFPAFYYIFRVVNKETKKTISYDEYLNLSDEDKAKYNVYPRLKVYNVFNIDQTNLKEARPELYKKLVEKNRTDNPDTEGKFHFDIADKMVSEDLWYCKIYPKKQDDAFYSPKRDEIFIPTIEQFKTGEAYYSTMFHEVAHSTGHKDRLNRLEGTTRFGSKEYGREELIAEMTAALICHLNGFNNGIKEESVAYLKGWCNNIKEEPKFIRDVLFEVKKAYSMISSRLEEIKQTQPTKKSKRATRKTAA